ncbi:hypothetical protein C2G38_2138146 [Gigaspora rosea]|uniref:Uncharacterized protein n=1 Tax=Gigaspora rosea TaxID=44941 RepID=A0A397VY94_9GLOM|nr:hypothetical protein C2G38_2138146 [Gigaspora rosea]
MRIHYVTFPLSFIEEFLPYASFVSEVDSDFNQETNEEDFAFDWQSLRNASKLVTELPNSDEEMLSLREADETNELLDSDDEFFESDEVFSEEFVMPISHNSNGKANHYCVIVDYDQEQHMIQRCNALATRGVHELAGAWEVDPQAVKKAGNDLSVLRICNHHLNYDNSLHPLSPGETCPAHTRIICGRKIQAPCRGLVNCPAITTYDGLSGGSPTNELPRFICVNCYVTHGGHLHIQPGRGGKQVSCIEKGEHNNDATSSLNTFSKWVEQTAASDNETMKVSLLKELVKTLNRITTNVQSSASASSTTPIVSTGTSFTASTISTNIPSTASTVPSSFLIKAAFKIKKINITKEAQATQLKEIMCKDFREILAHSVLNARPELKQNLPSIEEPKSLNEYNNAMPAPLLNFFTGLISGLKEKRRQVLARKRKERNLPSPQLDEKKIGKTSLFFISVLLGIAFPRWKIWFTHILSSLCRRPKMIGSLHKILHEVNVVSYVRDHEFQRPASANLNDASLESQSLFGISPIIEEWQKKLDAIFIQLIKKKLSFGAEDIDAAIREHIDSALFVAPPNVVILQPENGALNLVCDEAIYRRMNDYKNEEQTAHCILGQWHTNKAMCSALIVAFSGYGLFGLATRLGVRFLDRLVQIADYRATLQVLELTWIAVGVAIHLYAEENDVSINEIPEGSNNLLKIWFNFYQWAGYLKLHKLGIRMANFDLQIHSLMAFALLFPRTKKYRYSESVARFLSDLKKEPQFLQDLRTVPSINLTQPGHYFAFDESLETFSVKFVKENITGRATNPDNLKQNIKSAQSEYERLDLLISEFVEDQPISRSPRSVKNRKEALWDLIFELKLSFNNLQSETCTLFTETTQLTNDSYQRMFACYQSGIKTMETYVATGSKKWKSKWDLIPMKITKNKKKRSEQQFYTSFGIA